MFVELPSYFKLWKWSHNMENKKECKLLSKRWENDRSWTVVIFLPDIILNPFDEWFKGNCCTYHLKPWSIINFLIFFFFWDDDSGFIIPVYQCLIMDNTSRTI